MRSTIRNLAVMAAAALLSAAPIAARAQDSGKDPLRIGVVLSLSGPAAVFGIPERDAIKLVVDDINKAGGVDGRSIELVVFDDKTNPTEATRGVTQMATNENVLAVIGPGTGSGVLAAAPIAERYKLPLLAPVGTVSVTDPAHSFFPWVFRTNVNDYISISALFKKAVDEGAKRMAIVYQEDAFGKAGLEYATKLAPELGFELVDSVSVPANATDLSSQALRLRNARPDAVFIQLSIPTLAASFVRSMDQLKVDAQVYVGFALSQDSFIGTVGPAGNGVRVVTVGNLIYGPSATEQKLVDLLAADGKKPHGWPEIAGTTALMAVVAATEKMTTESTPSNLRESLESLCGFRVFVDARVCFSADNHDGMGPDAVSVMEIHEGRLRAIQ